MAIEKHRFYVWVFKLFFNQTSLKKKKKDFNQDQRINLCEHEIKSQDFARRKCKRFIIRMVFTENHSRPRLSKQSPLHDCCSYT